MVKTRLCAIFLMVFAAQWQTSHAWGYYAHERINLQAVDLMPDTMFAKLFPARAYLGMHASDADHRRSDPNEHHGHYIDLDIGDVKQPPFENIPHDYSQALLQIGHDSLARMGTLPWRIATYLDSTVESLRAGSPRAWKHMADLGHYVSDAHVPLHAVTDYDGQSTNNRGVHFRFEWWMIEAMRDSIRWTPESAQLLTDPRETIWPVLFESFSLVGALLSADDEVRDLYGGTSKEDRYIYERLGYSPDPRKEALFFRRVGTIAMDRMNASAAMVASFWLTAWDLAGRPPWPRHPARNSP